MQGKAKRIVRVSLSVISLGECIRLNLELQASRYFGAWPASCILFTTGYLGQSGGSRKIISDEPEGFLPAMDRAVKLGVFEGGQNFFEAWSRGVAEGFEVLASQEAGRADLLGGSLRQEALDEIVGAEIPVAREAVEPVQFEVFFEMIE